MLLWMLRESGCVCVRGTRDRESLLETKLLQQGVPTESPGDTVECCVMLLTFTNLLTYLPTHTHHFCITTVCTYLLLSFTNFSHGWQSAAITRELSAVMQKMNKLDSLGH